LEWKQNKGDTIDNQHPSLILIGKEGSETIPEGSRGVVAPKK
jgi:hypothetical protein